MQKVQKLYVAGPMTGLPDDNVPSFEYAAMRLRAAGFDVTSPHELENNGNRERFLGMTKEQVYREVLPGDCVAISKVDALVLLPGFEQSDGTNWEMHTAEIMGLEMFRPPYESGMIALEQWIDLTIQVIQNHNQIAELAVGNAA